MNTTASPKTLLTVQALRALAACAVVSYHVLFMLVHNGGYAFAVPSMGGSGVDLFFVISGFIMVYTNHGAFQQRHAVATFIRRRAIRIIPIYWLYTSVVVALLVFAPRLFSEVRLDGYNIICSYLFLLSKNSQGVVGTVMQTGWTLCFEVYFYLLFAIFLFAPRKYFLVLCGAVFIAGVVLVGASGLAIPPWATVATDPILFEFYLGAAIAFLYLKGFHLPRPLAVAAIVLAFSVIFLTGGVDLGRWTRTLCWGLPGAALLLGFISLEHTGMTVPKLFVALGDSSYSLYLVHPFIVPALGKVWVALHLSQKWPAACLAVLAFGCALVAGYVLYIAIEKPITRWLSTAGLSRRPTVPVGAVSISK
jgi:exopolysaccharide production protein ExoZ